MAHRRKNPLGMSRSGAVELAAWLGAGVVNALASTPRVIDPVTLATVERIPNDTVARISGALVVAAGVYGWSQGEHSRWIDALVILSGAGTLAMPDIYRATKRLEKRLET